MIDGLLQLIFNVHEAFTVALYTRKGDRLDCLSSVTFAKSFDKQRSLPIEGSLPGWVIKHNSPLVIPNYDRDEEALGYYGSKEDIKSFMGYPMETGGVIIVDSKKKYVFTEKEKKILSYFVSIISEEYEREKRSAERDDTLEELYAEKRILGLFNELNQSKVSIKDVLNEILQLSGGDFCFIGTERKGKLHIQDVAGPGNYEEIKRDCHTGESIASMVMEGGREMLLPHNSGYLRGKALFFPGEPFKAQQFFGFPLVTDDTSFGVIGFVALSENQLVQGAINALRNLSSLLSLYYTSQWMKEHIDRLKDFDSATGALQFPSFLAILEKMARKKENFYLISVKLLNMMGYNRAIGIEATNSLLKRVYQVIKYYAGDYSFICRKGGGRFIIMVKGKEAFETRNMIKLLNHAITKSLSEEQLSDGRDDVEIGMSRYPEDAQDIWGLLEKAENKTIRK